jgi:N,N'-diacetyllegionaminate synthase
VRAAADPEPVAIGGRHVGPGQPVLVVAEVGVNHDGDPEQALRLVEAAAGAGADAVKFQTFVPSRLASPRAAKAAYQTPGAPAGETQLAMLERLELPRSAYPRLRAACEAQGMLFLSTPFDEESADFLAAHGVPAFKAGSGDLTNLPLLRHLAGKGLPVILSTGMADEDEVAAAVDAVRAAGARGVVLLHATSSYPADPREANLRALPALQRRFATPVGLSDHTPGSAVALAAVALGAALVEKHLTLDRTLPGPDHAASLDVAGLAELVRGIRTVELALGDGVKRVTPGEAETRTVARRSLAARIDLPAGATLAGASLVALRPGTGIPPSELEQVVGRRLARPVAAGELLRLEDLE